MNTDQILDFESTKDYNRPSIELLSPIKFIFFCLLTLGFYSIWWMYKSWKFFKEKDNIDILPAARAIFAIFFVYDLFDRILAYAKSNGFPSTYSSGLLFVLYLGLNLTGYLPEPYLWISLLAFISFLLPLNALNFAIQTSDDYNLIKRRGFNRRQTVLVVSGLIIWTMILLAFLFADQ